MANAQAIVPPTHRMIGMERDYFEVDRTPALNLPSEYRSLAAALTPPRELRESWRARLREIIESEKTGVHGSEERLRLQTAADLAEWSLCAQPGDPLPNTLILRQGSGSFVYATGVDTELYRLPAPQRAKIDTLRSEWSDQATQREAVARVIRASPQYRALRALTLPAPRRARERPLRESEIAQRTASERATILAQHGLPAADTVAPGSLPDQRLRSIPGRVEMETVQGSRSDTATRAKVQAWFLRRAQDWWPREQRDGNIVKLSTRINRDPPKDTAELTATTTTGQTELVEDQAYDWSRYTFGDPGKHSILGRLEPAQFLAHNFAQQLFLDSTRDPATALEKAMEAAFRDALDYLHGHHDEAALLLREVPNPIHISVPNGSLARPGLGAPRPARVTEVPKAELERLSKETSGEVLHRGDSNDATRLILPAATAGQYPRLGPRLRSYDLVVALTDEALSRIGEPDIPGLDVVARSAHRWAFRRSSDDPYERSGDGLVLDPHGVADLVEMYRAIGLRSLAHAITTHRQRHDRVSAFDLERLIPQHSSYPLPKYAPPPDPNAPEHPPVEWFARYVEDGRLHVQCNGAAPFLAASLTSTLPDCDISIVNGLVLSRGDRITQLIHAQTALIRGDRLYLLDATAPAPPGLGLTDDELRQSPRRRIGRRAHAKKAPSTAPHVQNREAAEVMRLAAAAAAVPSQMENVVHNLYGCASRDETHRRITALKKTDPIRRALAAGRNPSRTDVARVVASLDRYVADRPDVRARAAREAGVSDAPEVVAMLADCLRPLIPAVPTPSQSSQPGSPQLTSSMVATARTRLNRLRQTVGRRRR